MELRFRCVLVPITRHKTQLLAVRHPNRLSGCGFLLLFGLSRQNRKRRSPFDERSPRSLRNLL